jgi:hypothetical protein
MAAFRISALRVNSFFCRSIFWISSIAQIVEAQLSVPDRNRVAQRSATTIVEIPRGEPVRQLLTKVDLGRERQAAATQCGLPRRSAIARGVICPAVCWVLAGCAGPEAERLAPSPPASEPQDDLTRLRDGAEPVVAGEVLDGPLLRGFYARRGFAPVWNTRPALADALVGLINDPELCEAMGNAGRALAERAFDVRQVVAAHLRIYQELIDKS